VVIPKAPPAARSDAFSRVLTQVRPVRVIGVDIRDGSRLDSEDYRRVWRSQPAYLAMAVQLE